MDVNGLEALLRDLAAGDVEILTRELATPSPLAQEIISARPYAFLDDAPAEERRTRAIRTRNLLDPGGGCDDRPSGPGRHPPGVPRSLARGPDAGRAARRADPRRIPRRARDPARRPAALGRAAGAAARRAAGDRRRPSPAASPSGSAPSGWPSCSSFAPTCRPIRRSVRPTPAGAATPRAGSSPCASCCAAGWRPWAR